MLEGETRTSLLCISSQSLHCICCLKRWSVTTGLGVLSPTYIPPSETCGFSCELDIGCACRHWEGSHPPSTRWALCCAMLGLRHIWLHFLLYHHQAFPLLFFLLFPSGFLPHLLWTTTSCIGDLSDPTTLANTARRAPGLHPAKSNSNLQLLCKHNSCVCGGSAGTQSK